MPYTINYSDSGKPAIILNDGTVDTSTSLVLIGKNVTNFGEYLNENLLHLLENYANGTEPTNPTEGQLWYNTTESQLYIYDNGQWYPIGFPLGDTTVVVRNRQDTIGVYHKTIEHIVDGQIVHITVDDTTSWVPHPTEFLEDGVTRLDTQFPTIQSGINMNTTTDYKFRGTATSAEYADLAERYAADAEYSAGTVVTLGGSHEITQTVKSADEDVFGIISTAPGFEMNSGAGTDATHPYVALAGRVPCKVVGKVQKGQRLITSDTPGHAQADTGAGVLDYRLVIGRALESKDSDGEGTIEVVVGAK